MGEFAEDTVRQEYEEGGGLKWPQQSKADSVFFYNSPGTESHSAESWSCLAHVVRSALGTLNVLLLVQGLYSWAWFLLSDGTVKFSDCPFLPRAL
jgi:hypothetical protein